jgi:signal transduction histidine kinase
MTTNVEAQRHWKDLLCDVYDRLEQHERRIGFLRQLDNHSDDSSVDLEEFVRRVVDGLAGVLDGPAVHFYMESGRDLYLLHSSSADSPQAIIRASRLSAGLPGWDSVHQVPIGGEDGRFGVLVLTEDRSARFSRLRDPELASLAQTVAGQVQIGIRSRLDRKRAQWREALYGAFFRRGLDPGRCFMHLAMSIPDYLPMYGPFRIAPPPQAQVLIYHPDGGFLTIVGCDEGEPGQRVTVKDSVVGLLFERPDDPYVLGDPTKAPLKKRYKSYLGRKRGKEMRTELAVPVADPQGRRMAVFNLESENEKAFAQSHVDSLIELTASLAGVVSSLCESTKDAEDRQVSAMAAQRSYWTSVGDLLVHDVTTPLLAIEGNAELAQQYAKQGETARAAQSLSRVAPGTKTVHRVVKEFARDLPTYTITGRYWIRQLLDEVVSKWKPEGKRRGISIEYPDGPDFDVCCSPFLKLHIHNLVDNAMYWVGRKIADEPTHRGVVRVLVEEGEPPLDGQEKALNETCVVTVWDNGPGCPEEVRQGLLSGPVESRRNGMGRALHAAAEYVESLGGAMATRSREGEWFEVGISLPRYREALCRIMVLGQV